MNQQIISQIEDEFTGFNGDTIFRLTNGQIWQQNRYKYWYHYAYRPEIKIYQDDYGAFVLEILGMNQSVEVVQAYMVMQEKIVSDFKGHKYGTLFEFHNGYIWKQIENKYRYHHAYSPTAYVINGINGLQLFVNGMNDTVKVQRVK